MPGHAKESSTSKSSIRQGSSQRFMFFLQLYKESFLPQPKNHANIMLLPTISLLVESTGHKIAISELIISDARRSAFPSNNIEIRPKTKFMHSFPSENIQVLE
ncbi:hypothetical protein NE237_004790 [Protea cynaroides]|uniref:Uncharacterized protein n=1 Tax=Protea cynaroides TaxID=273540 RepID=A0A9Q0KK64_9MAGN|nr:hypothetical protein NE237_004790 [Protea cynaroides]